MSLMKEEVFHFISAKNNKLEFEQEYFAALNYDILDTHTSWSFTYLTFFKWPCTVLFEIFSLRNRFYTISVYFQWQIILQDDPLLRRVLWKRALYSRLKFSDLKFFNQLRTVLSEKDFCLYAAKTLRTIELAIFSFFKK